jgi:hypothetical protein
MPPLTVGANVCSFTAVDIERGNTQKGVNQEIIRFLTANHIKPNSAFDLPCGDGPFLRNLTKVFKNIKIKGQDLMATPTKDIEKFFNRAGSDDWRFLENEKVDLITCISGVMAFDNLTDYFQKAQNHLNPGGHLVVTNDNLFTVRDRISLLLFGRFKRFVSLYKPNEGNWNVVLPQAIWKLYRNNNFKVVKIQYCSLYVEDLIFLPLAVILYPIQFLYLMSQKSEMTMKERYQLFPFQVMLCRHYIFYGQKNN